MSSDPILREIALLREMLLSFHYFEESTWLALAAASPSLCKSQAGKAALRRVALIAAQFGFPALSDWITEQVLGHSDASKSAQLKFELAACDPISGKSASGDT